MATFSSGGVVDVNSISSSKFADASDVLGGSIAPLVENGLQARQGDIPHHVTVYIRRGNRWFFTSGALIADDWIITQASSLAKSQEVRVYYGSHQLPSSKIAFVKRIVVHPYYETKVGIFNVALLQLRQPVSVDHSTRPIALPPTNFVNAVLDNQNIWISGFGSKGKCVINSSIMDRLNQRLVA